MMIELKSVSFSYEAGKPVLNDLSMTIGDNDRLAVMGESGIGKTTLFRLLLGLEKPTGGEIFGLENKKLSVVWQENRLFPWYDALKNITVAIEKSDEAKAEALLIRLGLEEHLHKFPSELSGGQQRRLAIARALYYGGDLLLLDEPFTGLDTELKKRAAAIICESFPSILLITHDEADAALLDCRRVISLN